MTMSKKHTWTGKYALVVRTGELVEVVSYDDISVQVKNSRGFAAKLLLHEVSKAHGATHAKITPSWPVTKRSVLVQRGMG